MTATGNSCFWLADFSNLSPLKPRDEMNNLYRGPPIDASYQVSVHLAKRFQRRQIILVSDWLILKCFLIWNRLAKWTETR
jgi:hypothetical protein